MKLYISTHSAPFIVPSIAMVYYTPPLNPKHYTLNLKPYTLNPITPPQKKNTHTHTDTKKTSEAQGTFDTQRPEVCSAAPGSLHSVGLRFRGLGFRSLGFRNLGFRCLGFRSLGRRSLGRAAFSWDLGCRV